MTMPSYEGEVVDVCVVGSGAGGGPIAMTLAAAGAKVVVLEKGPWYDRDRFTHDEITVVRRDMWRPSASEQPHVLMRGTDAPERTTEGWIANCVGGGTVHMSGFFYRLHAEDFRMKQRYGEIEGASLADWPIAYEDLAPFYDQVEREIGISGDPSGNPFEPARSGPYPLPPLRENPLAGLVERGASALGLHAYKTARAIASEPFRGRAGCVYCDFCSSFGCEVGAKSSSLSALIPRAVETEKCEVRPNAMAYEVVYENDRVRGVRYYDAQGETKFQEARVVCVSASSVESARLLLMSRSGRYPNGIGNDTGLVGKNLCFSTLAKGYGSFDVASLPEEMRANHPIHFLNRSLQDFYLLSERAGEYDKGGTIGFLLPPRGPIFAAERIASRSSPPLWGTALKQALEHYYREVREIEFEVYGEFMPNPSTFVDLDTATQDKWGLPVAAIHLVNHPEDIRNAGLVAQHARAVLSAAGATSTEIETWGTTFILQHGTCRFGTDSASTVLDVTCQAHGVPNLYVVDGSFMPSSGAVPTTLTILANSFRVASLLEARFRRGEIGR